MDVAEVALQTLARVVREGDKRLPAPASLPGDVTADLVVAARVIVFGHQASKHLRGRMPLLAGRLFVVG